MPADLSPTTTVSLDTARVEDAMHRGVLSCPFETPLRTVARMMADNGVHCVVGIGDVTEDDTFFWGVVSDRDVLVAAAAGEEEEHDAGSRATANPVTVAPGDTLRHAAEIMAREGVSHLIVAETGTDRPLGVLSTLDIARAVGGVRAAPGQHGASRVDQLMTARVATATPEMTLKEVAAVLVERGISGMPVVRDGDLVGVVSEADIVSLEQGAGSGRSRTLAWLLGEAIDTAPLTATTAGDVMSAPAITISSHQAPAVAAALMTKHDVNRLPVLEDGKLVGIVSRRDLVRAFARPDDEIAKDIRREVIVREFWISPEEVFVEVEDGEVTLSGAVDSDITAAALPEAVRKVPGVVSVSSSIVVRR
jgi:CBS domain-containing protein